MSLIECRDLTRTYRRGPEEITPLDGLDLDLEAGRFVSLMGPSGSGKTTLLNVLTGRLEGFTGRVATTGVVGALRVAYIAQEDVFLPQLTASEHLEFLASLLIVGIRSRC